MDYKYIEQLLERYWLCETSPEEEAVLKAFFSQRQIPRELEPYRPLFAFAKEERETGPLGSDFDARILSLTEDMPTVKARRLTWKVRLAPLYKAAATVAIIVTLGNAAQITLGGGSTTDSDNYSGYQDTFSDPEMAYDEMHNALELLSGGISLVHRADSAAEVRGVCVSQDSVDE